MTAHQAKDQGVFHGLTAVKRDGKDGTTMARTRHLRATEMFKHVLIPTDGSPLSRKAVKAGIAFARQIGAKVTAYNATEVVPEYAAGGFILPSVLEQFETGALKQAQKHLQEVAKVARAAGVPCESKSSSKATVYQGIIDAAKKNKCDVIFMASHGRGEVASAVLGSVTLHLIFRDQLTRPCG